MLVPGIVATRHIYLIKIITHVSRLASELSDESTCKARGGAREAGWGRKAAAGNQFMRLHSFGRYIKILLVAGKISGTALV